MMYRYFKMGNVSYYRIQYFTFYIQNQYPLPCLSHIHALLGIIALKYTFVRIFSFTLHKRLRLCTLTHTPMFLLLTWTVRSGNSHLAVQDPNLGHTASSCLCGLPSHLYRLSSHMCGLLFHVSGLSFRVYRLSLKSQSPSQDNKRKFIRAAT